MIRNVRSTSILIGGLVLATACGGRVSEVVVSRSTNDPPSKSATASSSDPSGSTTAASTSTDSGSSTGNDPADTGTDTGQTGEPSRSDPPAAGDLEWEPLSSGSDIEVSSLDVPVDYNDPSGPQFNLFIAKRPANDQANKIGTLLVNPGGPGFGGSVLAIQADFIYNNDLLDRFDIVGWDPRGTGESTPAIDCVDDYDYYYAEIDSTPDDEAEHQHLIDVAQEFADECVANNSSIIEFVGTNNSARDINSIREALGEEKISYFGFSYGSELGATWVTLFPDTVRAAVLDGAADPTADSYTSQLQQLTGFEASLETFLSRCDETRDCEFDSNGTARETFEQLMADLDANPIPSDPGRPPVNRDVAMNGSLYAMYDESLWPVLDEGLASALDGDGSGLLGLHDGYFQRISDGKWGNELEAFQTISCEDTTERPTVEEVDQQAASYREVAPLLVPEGSAGGYFCTFFPPSVDPRVDITGAGAGPIVVVGTTGDPATPLESSRKMADTLEDGRLVIVNADQHTGYGVNDCIDSVVDTYLVDLVAPENGTEC